MAAGRFLTKKHALRREFTHKDKTLADRGERIERQAPARFCSANPQFNNLSITAST